MCPVTGSISLGYSMDRDAPPAGDIYSNVTVSYRTKVTRGNYPLYISVLVSSAAEICAAACDLRRLLNLSCGKQS